MSVSTGPVALAPLLAALVAVALLGAAPPGAHACAGYEATLAGKGLTSCNPKSMLVPKNSSAKLTKNCNVNGHVCFNALDNLKTIQCTATLKTNFGTFPVPSINVCDEVEKQYREEDARLRKSGSNKKNKFERARCPVDKGVFCIGHSIDISKQKNIIGKANGASVELKCTHVGMGASCLTATVKISSSGNRNRG